MRQISFGSKQKNWDWMCRHTRFASSKSQSIHTSLSKKPGRKSTNAFWKVVRPTTNWERNWKRQNTKCEQNSELAVAHEPTDTQGRLRLRGLRAISNQYQRSGSTLR